jgi:hypothetical protein
VPIKNAFHVEVDATRNLVHTRYCGNVTAEQMKNAIAEVERQLPEMRAGFAVLADLTCLDTMELECAPHLSRIMDLCRAQGVGLVVRVIPDPSKDIGLNILSLIHYRGKVRIVTCDTLEEAERALK